MIIIWGGRASTQNCGSEVPLGPQLPRASNATIASCPHHFSGICREGGASELREGPGLTAVLNGRLGWTKAGRCEGRSRGGSGEVTQNKDLRTGGQRSSYFIYHACIFSLLLCGVKIPELAILTGLVRICIHFLGGLWLAFLPASPMRASF